MPAAVPLTPETYARLWATLWITLWDTATGRVRIGRAVALRPEFTHALHGVLREQAMRPFHVASAERALDGLRFAAGPLELRARVDDQVRRRIGSRRPMGFDPGGARRRSTGHLDEETP